MWASGFWHMMHHFFFSFYIVLVNLHKLWVNLFQIALFMVKFVYLNQVISGMVPVTSFRASGWLTHIFYYTSEKWHKNQDYSQKKMNQITCIILPTIFPLTLLSSYMNNTVIIQNKKKNTWISLFVLKLTFLTLYEFHSNWTLNLKILDQSWIGYYHFIIVNN